MRTKILNKPERGFANSVVASTKLIQYVMQHVLLYIFGHVRIYS